MPSFIRNPKDFWSGVIFIFFGLAAIIIGLDYSMGTAGRMGPSYFPTALGGLLGVVGLVSVLRSFFSAGEAIGKIAFKEIALIIAGVLLFGFIVRGAGLLPAVLLLVMISSFASIKFRPLPTLLLAIGMAAFSTLVFVKAIGLPMPILGAWFGF